jgi:hypothetical protein
MFGFERVPNIRKIKQLNPIIHLTGMTNQVSVLINPASGIVFFRLAYP